MGHGTSAILDNLKESLFNVTEKLKEFGNETDFEKVLKVNNEVSDVLASLKELDEALSSFTSEQVTAKLEEATSLINTVQTKLDNDDFKGDKGTSISKVENKNNKLVITDSESKEYDLGNYVNDYNLLNNKPIDNTSLNLNFFRFSFNQSLIGFEYFHLKTNIPKNNKMLRFDFVGYAYGSIQSVDSTLLGYTYSASSSLYRRFIKNNDYDLIKDTYYSDDGFLVIVFSNTSLNLSFSVSLSSIDEFYKIDVSSLKVTDYLFTPDPVVHLFKGIS